MSSSASLPLGTGLPICFAKREALHRLKLHLATARLRSGMRAYIGASDDTKTLMISFLQADLDICFRLLGVAYALGFQISTPKLLSCLASLPLLDLHLPAGVEDIVNDNFNPAQDEAILKSAGIFYSWWTKSSAELPQESPISSLTFNKHFSLYLQELSRQHDALQPLVSLDSSHSAQSIQQAYPYWEISEAGLNARQPIQPDTGRAPVMSLEPANARVPLEDIRASVVRAISVVDKTAVFAQAAMGRASEAAERSKKAINAIQHLKDLYCKDNLGSVGIDYRNQGATEPTPEQ